jgi:photosystem II stability/assembly factor-like uncharacterized protein
MLLHLRKVLLLSIIFFTKFVFAQNTSGNWTIKGPVLFPTDISEQINGIGRVSQIKFHSTDNQKIYAVSASGGLWISSDAGLSWNKTTTDLEIPQGSCSAICVDPTNDNILYLSTGDANYYSNEYGIYKSSNGGLTWNSSNSGIDNRMALEILVSPNNNNTILAATTDGIWKSEDAGTTWNVKKNGGFFKDMEYKPGSTTTIYAVNDNQFWRSTNDGETWSQIASVNPIVGSGGRITTSPSNSSIVYVGFVGSNNYSTTTSKGGIIYKSTDSGETFTLKKGNNQPNLNGYEPTENGQGDYNWDIFADRINANIVYAVGHVVWKSTNSGVTWSKLTNWYENCHTDMHQIISSPYDNNKLYNINDGGVFTSTDEGNNWEQISDGISATEIYHMGQSKLSRNIVSIGTQDNGEIYLNNNAWFCNRGGDWGSKVTFDYSNPNIAYYHENATKRDLVVNGPIVSYGITSPNNNDNYVFTDQNTSFGLVSQGAKLKKTTNLLATSPTWSTVNTFTGTIKSVAVSPTNINEIYVVLDNGQVEYTSNGSTFTQVSIAPSITYVYSTIVVNKNNTNIIYLTCGDRVYRSVNKAVDWLDISGTLSSGNILNLIHDPYKSDESFYLATPFGVYYRNNSMTDWTSFSTGLPLIAKITDLFGYFDGTSNSVIRVSFFGRGVWESDLYNDVLSTNEHVNSVGTISIYPNPSTDIITVNVTQPELIDTKAVLFDITGKQIKEILIKEPVTLLDFSGYTKGIYLLKFENNIIKKIIVK